MIAVIGSRIHEPRGRALSTRGEAETAGREWFLALGDRELERAYRLAGFLLGDAREAEDATQDALGRAWTQRTSSGTARMPRPGSTGSSSTSAATACAGGGPASAGSRSKPPDRRRGETRSPR